MHIQEEAFKDQMKAAKGQQTTDNSPDAGSSGLWAVVGDAFGFASVDDDEDTDLPSSSTATIPFDNAFLIADHSLDSQWAQFKAVLQPPLQEAHKQAIKSNDEALRALYMESVPEMLSDEQFWRAWMFHQFLKKAQQSTAPVHKPPKSKIEWDTWDNEELTTPNTRDFGGLGSAKDGNDWEEWD